MGCPTPAGPSNYNVNFASGIVVVSMTSMMVAMCSDSIVILNLRNSTAVMLIMMTEAMIKWIASIE